MSQETTQVGKGAKALFVNVIPGVPLATITKQSLLVPTMVEELDQKPEESFKQFQTRAIQRAEELVSDG